MTTPLTGALTVKLPATKELKLRELQCISTLIELRTKEIMTAGQFSATVYEELTALYTLSLVIDDWIYGEAPEQKENPLTLAKLTDPCWVKDCFEQTIAPHLELNHLITERLKI